MKKKIRHDYTWNFFRAVCPAQYTEVRGREE